MISVCFITKNEEKNLKDCIEHLRPLVQEFVVMDTGSTDATVEIAKGSGARVATMPWPNDFSAARNAALALATQPWVLKIDPDERLNPKDFSKIRSLLHLEAPPAYQFWTRAYTNDPHRVQVQSYQKSRGEFPEFEKNYQGFVTYPSIRLFQRLPGVRYIGKIHESVESTLPGFGSGPSPVSMPLEIYFHHYGHDDEVFAEKNKTPFYFELLLEETAANPKNWYANFELGIHYFREQKFDLAVRAFEAADHAHPNKAQVLSNLGWSLALAGRASEGERILKKLLLSEPQYLDGWLNLGALFLETDRIEFAFDAFNQALVLDSHSAVGLRGRAQTLAKFGQWKKAEADLLKAIEILPEFIEAKADLAILHLHLGRKTESRAFAEEILKKIPSHQRALAILEKAKQLST